jgi:hypothetical protein
VQLRSSGPPPYSRTPSVPSLLPRRRFSDRIPGAVIFARANGHLADAPIPGVRLQCRGGGRYSFFPATSSTAPGSLLLAAPGLSHRISGAAFLPRSVSYALTEPLGVLYRECVARGPGRCDHGEHDRWCGPPRRLSTLQARLIQSRPHRPLSWAAPLSCCTHLWARPSLYRGPSQKRCAVRRRRRPPARRTLEAWQGACPPHRETDRAPCPRAAFFSTIPRARPLRFQPVQPFRPLGSAIYRIIPRDMGVPSPAPLTLSDRLRAR